MKRITTILLLLCTVLMASALDKRQTKINSIKKSKEFLYSDITMSSQEDANSQAVELLQNEIISWAKDRAENRRLQILQSDIQADLDIEELEDKSGISF